MGNVVDIAVIRRARRARREKDGIRTSDRIPDREPDIVVEAWVENGEVQWITAHGPFLAAAEKHDHATAALLDAAWVYGASMNPTTGEEKPARPAVWWMLDTAGNNVFLREKGLSDGSSWRNARWLARHWWILTKRCIRLGWAMIQSKGPA